MHRTPAHLRRHRQFVVHAAAFKTPARPIPCILPRIIANRPQLRRRFANQKGDHDNGLAQSPVYAPPHHASELEHIVKTTIEAVLPGALAQLLAVGSSTSDPTATPSIATRISTRIAADAGERLQVTYIRKLDKLRTDTLNDAYDVRVTADDEFFEELGNHTTDLTIVKEEGITEIRDQLESTVEKLTETAEAIRDKTNAEMREYVGELCIEACERLGDAVVMEKARCMRRITMGWAARQDVHAGQGRRAASLPL